MTSAQFKLNSSEDYIKSLKKAEELFQKKNLLKSNLKTLYIQSINSKKNLSIFSFNSSSESKFQEIESSRSDHSKDIITQPNLNDNFQQQEQEQIQTKQKSLEIQNNTDYFQIVDKLQSDIIEITKLCQEFKFFKQQINNKISSINTQTQEKKNEDNKIPRFHHEQELIYLENSELKSKLKKAEEYIKILKIRNQKLILQLRQESQFKQKMDPINFIQDEMEVQDIYHQIMDLLKSKFINDQQLKKQTKYEKYIRNLKKILCNYFRADWTNVKKIIQYDKYTEELRKNYFRT